jgi:NAD(P)-dependent dehydrogenase (short-subunit alcohol dehydrogenase family)
VELRDRSIVITGAANGIGRALAHRFAAEQPRALILADIEREAVREVASEVDGLAVPCDVGIQADVVSLIDQARAHAGPIDVFFSNAGIAGPSGGPVGTGADAWDASWRVNVMSHVWAAEALLPEMLARGEGYLASTASAGGILTTPGMLVYSVTKHAAVALAEWIAITYGDAGIRVSCLCPMAVRTRMMDSGLDNTPEVAVELRDEVLEPTDVAEAVVGGLREERFLILPQPQVAKYWSYKSGDNERWLRGMRRVLRAVGEGSTG